MNHNVKRIVEHRWCTVTCECGETFDNADTAKAVQAWGDHYAEARQQPPSEVSEHE